MSPPRRSPVVPGRPAFGASYRSLADWRSRHGELLRRLVVARRVVPEPDEARWRAALGALDAALRLHLGQEERWLLPAFDEVAGEAAPNQGPVVVRRDHRRIEALLDDLAAAADPVDRTVGLGALADVLDHHDRREDQGMLPILDRLAADRVPGWLGAIAAEEVALGEAPVVVPTGERRPDPPVEPDPLRALVIAAAWDRPLPLVAVEVPAHPKGPRLHARLAEAVAAAESAPTLEARRDHLGEVVDRARLLALVARSAGRA